MALEDIQSIINNINGSSNVQFGASNLSTTITDSIESVRDSATQSAVIKDHYRNSLTATGDDDIVQSFTNYGFSNDTLNWTLWVALYNDSWVFRTAIDKPAQDEVNCGITLHGDYDIQTVMALYDRYTSQLIDLLKWGALFGGSVGVIMFDNVSEEELAKPLNKEKIKGHRFRLYVTDRWYGGYAKVDKMVTNMNDIDYGKPMYYEIVFPDGKNCVVHHSYILRYEHRSAPPLIKNGQLQGWGYAEGAHIVNELARDDQLKSSITSLVNKSLIEVIKMSGMRGVFMGTDKGNEEQLRKRLEMVNWGRNFNSLTFLDKDDDYQQYTMSSLTGLSNLLETNMWQISAALEMQGILFGELKGGLSTDTESMKRYATTIKARCNAYVRPVITKFLKIIFCVLGIDSTVNFDFNSLYYVEENKEKVAGLKSLSDVLKSLCNEGVISKYTYAQTIRSFMTYGTIDLAMSDEFLDMLKLQEQNDIIKGIEKSAKGENKVVKKPSELGGDIGDLSDLGDISDLDEGDIGGVDIPEQMPLEQAPEEEIPDLGEMPTDEGTSAELV